ncbi:hypothetical protein FKM82_018932 [Ascaphus truei]
MAEGERASETGGDTADQTGECGGSPGAQGRAEELKAQANEYFRVKDYDRAVQYYTQAIALSQDSAIYYGNRSLAYLRTECYGYALADASRAIQLDAKYIKGYYRRATSNMALGKFKAALKDYETVVKVRPQDRDAQMKFHECSKMVRQKAFERAIACEQQNRSVVDSLDIEGMTIEDEYTGPQLQDGKVTLDFMVDLMQFYKDQKKIHRKCIYQILVQVKEILSQLPSLVEISLEESEQVTVCGDTHGQFYDMMNIFHLNGLPSESNPYVSFTDLSTPRPSDPLHLGIRQSATAI